MSLRRHFVIVSAFVAFATAAGLAAGEETQSLTPLLLSVQDAPVPFVGSDGRTHLVYELWVANVTSADVAVEAVEVQGDGVVLQSLDAASVAARLQPAGQRESSGVMAKSTQSLLFLNIALEPGAAVPALLSHRVKVEVMAAPPEKRKMQVAGGDIEVDRRKVVVIGPPLGGERYVSADSCCDATRHTRAALPVNGRVRLAQRFAVDWEQLDAGGRIYSGPGGDVKSYTIFGQPALAVADAVVSSTTDGLAEQTPGKYPTDISLDAADGNSVVLDLGEHRFALYAHLQPGSLRVRRGDRVKRGQVLGLVGNTGNSFAPHLHFHVMDGPLSLAANGLPYEIDDFQVTGQTPGTAAFDEAESKGVPVQVIPRSPAERVKDALPLDQLIITFPAVR